MANGQRIGLPVVRPLEDGYERKIQYLRISLTDRCNYRCTYCMPEEGVELLPKEQILTFEELERLAAIFSGLGVRRIRLTGGEPTIRKRVVEIVGRLAAVEGIDELVMTSNGHRFPELAQQLADAGLAGVNISIDTLDPAKFAALTRRGDLERVVAGIDAAVAAGMTVKLNAVALADTNGDELADLCQFAWDRGTVVRFIEHMPMSSGLVFVESNQLAAGAIRDRIAEAFGQAVEPCDPDDAVAGPARYFQVGSPHRRFGIISAMTEHFCDTCNRVRLTSTGELHTCLAFDDATNLRSLLRSDASDDQIRAAITAAVQGKRQGHEFKVSGIGGPRKHMVSIGG